MSNALYTIGSETYLLSLLLTGGISVSDVIDNGGYSLFGVEKNIVVVKTIVKSGLKDTVNIRIVEDLLSKAGRIDIVADNYLQSIVCEYADPEELQQHLDELKKYARKRAVKKILDDSTDDIYKSDVKDIIGSVTSKLSTIDTGDGAEHSLPITEAMSKTFDMIESAQRNGGVTGLKTGLESLDDAISGLSGGELIVLAARPGMGKSALAFKVAHNISKAVPVVFFTLEMTAINCCMRLLADCFSVDYSRIRSGFMTKQEMSKILMGVGDIVQSKLTIDDNPNQSLASIRQAINKSGAGCVVIDYLQLMTIQGRHENRNAAITELTRGLKLMAKEYNIPVIVLSQLNRAVETRQASKIPQLSDLRESGAIEQDADIVMFIHRNYKYSFDEAEKYLAQIIIAKQRNGPCVILDYRFVDEYLSFKEINKKGGSDETEDIF